MITPMASGLNKQRSTIQMENNDNTDGFYSWQWSTNKRKAIMTPTVSRMKNGYCSWKQLWIQIRILNLFIRAVPWVAVLITAAMHDYGLSDWQCLLTNSHQPRKTLGQWNSFNSCCLWLLVLASCSSYLCCLQHNRNITLHNWQQQQPQPATSKQQQ